MPGPSSGASQPSGSPLVGRVREQQLLREHFTASMAGRGSLVLIGGEAGIGKTTLVEALAGEAHAAGALVLAGHCYDLTTTPPFGPWIDLLERFRRSDEARSLPAISANTDLSSQSAWFETVYADLTRLAAQRPVVLILEDLHWADDASLDLLRYLARGTGDRPVLIVATYRDDEITRRHPLSRMLPLLVRESGADRLNVPRFDTADLEALVHSRFDLSDSDRTRLVAYLQQSDGNAFFATELLRSLVDERRLAFVDGSWRLAEINQAQVPVLVQQMIEARLGRLDDATQRLLEIAALIGQDVPLELWSQVSNAPDTDLADAVERAVAAGLLVPGVGGSRVHFSHALVRETLIDRQILLRRRPWHQRVADALAAQPSPDPDAISYHLEQANDPRRKDWLIRAGERAQQRFAWLMAAERFERAAELYSGPEQAVERAWLLFRIGLLVRNDDLARSLAHLEEAEAMATALDEPLLAALACAHQGLVRCHSSDVRRGIDELERGVLALDQIDADGRAQLERVTAEWEAILGVQGRGTLALKLADVGRFREAETLLVGLDARERERSPDADRAAGVIYAYLGRPDLARRAFRRSQAAYFELNDRDAAGSDGFHMLLQVQIPYALDQVVERRELVRATQELWTDPVDPDLSLVSTQVIETGELIVAGAWTPAMERLNAWVAQSPYWMTPFHIWRLRLARDRGETQEVWEAIHRALPDGPETEPGERNYFVYDGLQPLAAELALDIGDLPRARRWLEAHDRLLEWSGAVLGRAENRILWARYEQIAGDVTSARQYAEEAFALASDPRQPLALIECNRVLGALDSAEGHHPEAEARLQQALTLAGACEAPFERALTLLALAELRIATREHAAARTLLEEARAICTPLEASLTLEYIAMLETGLEDASTSLPRYPDGLTTREVEVLRLIAAGASNRAIADTLFLSHRTVERHIANIYLKIDAHSKAEATAYAVRHGLVRPDQSAGLSPRELEVLRLLVDGKSNQEIAAELFISYHTATSHVANILGKLGVESRTAAATYAIRHGLV